jgi:hypothetical protein
MATTSGANSYTAGNFVLSLYPTLCQVPQAFQFDSEVRGPVRLVNDTNTTIQAGDFTIHVIASSQRTVEFPTSASVGRIVILVNNNDSAASIEPTPAGGVTLFTPSLIGSGQGVTYMLVAVDLWVCIGKSF